MLASATSPPPSASGDLTILTREFSAFLEARVMVTTVSLGILALDTISGMVALGSVPWFKVYV
jgi:hypothetical protein